MVNGWGRRVAGVLASAVLTLAGAPGASAQTPVASVFGPVDMVRAAGAPVTRSWTFSVAALDPNGYSVCVANGGSARQYPPVTSARVTLNGAALFRPNDFNPHVTSLSRQAVLRASNTLTVEIQGQPGSGLTIAIHRGQTCSAPPAGNHPPVFTSTPVTSATLLEPYAYQVTAIDPDSDPLSYSLVSSPAGMTMTASGAIAWTPPGTGAFGIVVRAVDPSMASTTQSYTLSVGRAANRPPVLTPITNRRVPAGVPFQLGLSADDPDPGDTVVFLLNSGPAGAAIAGGQAVSWSPTFANLGTHAFSITARDSAGATAIGAFTVEVVASNGAPVLDALDDITTPVGSPYQRTLTASDPNPGDALTFGLLAGPAGLSLSPQGALTWTPAAGQLGDHRVTVSVTDNTGLVDAGAFTITVGVAGIPQPPIARDDRYAVRRGATLSVPPPGVLSNDDDPAGLPLTSSLVEGPAKGSLTLAADGAFTYTPTPPVPGGTEPALAFAHTLQGVTLAATYTQPVVADLDADDRAEIIYLGVGSAATRRLMAVHGDTGATYWAVNVYQPGGTPDLRLSLNGELTVADLDPDGLPETLAIHSDDETTRLRNRIVAFNANGTYRWTSADIIDGTVTSTTGMFYTTVSDINGDGVPEILALHKGRTVDTPVGIGQEDLLTVFNRDGSIRMTVRIPGNPSSSRLTVADIDVDGTPEIVIGGAVLTPAGAIRWNIKPSIVAVVDVAVGNLDADPFAEIVYKDQFNNISVHEHTGVRKWGPIKNPALSDSSGLAIGDVDGDGLSEILVGQDGVEVWSRSGVLLMEMNLPNGLLGYGGTPTVFDLNGDGRPEVVYNGQTSPFDVGFVRGGLYIFDGASGSLLHSLYAPRGGGGWPANSPVIADVNGDGSAEIVTGGWNEQIGIRVFRAANGTWSDARPVWSDPSYHVTNIAADGSIPASAAINWLTPGLNNFRVQALLASERSGIEGDRFTYVASNGSLASNMATVGIDILPPNTAPLILSTPPNSASPGLEYLYAVRAVDPDVGELITYDLPIAPIGMTVDTATGLVRWTPTPHSPLAVTAVVRATDSQGQSSSQSFAITIATAVSVPDVVGRLLEDAPGVFDAAGVALGTVTLSPSSAPVNSVISQEPLPGVLVASGSLIDLVVSSGPAPVAVPYLIGKSDLEALNLLATRGLGSSVTHAFSNTTPAGRVFAQSPSAGTPLVPGSVQISVSAGSGLTLRLQRSQAPAGGSITFSAVAYDLQRIESPAPPLTFTVAAEIQPSFGAVPTVSGHTISSSADTRGAFRITATDPATGHSTSATFAITFPLVAGQRSMNDVFAGMGEAVNEIATLAAQARAALAVNDTVQMRSLLDQMVRRWRLVDVNMLHLSTPFLLPQGFYPTPSELPSLGLTPVGDDLLAEEAFRAVMADLEAWTAGLREPSTSMTTLRALADQFNASAERAAALKLGQWGVIKTQPLITMLVSECLPDFYAALMDELAQTVINAGGPGPTIEMSTLPELSVTQVVTFVVEKALEQASPIVQVREAMLGHAAWSAAAVIGANQFKQRVQGQSLTAVVAGGSLSFRTFSYAGVVLTPWSFIEADLDIDYPESAVVITIGPDQVDEPDFGTGGVTEAVSSLIATVQTGNQLSEALFEVYRFIRTGKADGVAEKIAGAFQGRGTGYRGCLFSSSPTCSQLVYENGFKSVYTLQQSGGFESFAGLPVPILFMVFDRGSGTVYVDTPVFLPVIVPLIP